ncbi:ABC transporter ATP-binding protein [Streptomyces harbinensis]|uniref:ABC transporter ATP-binding protein n=1 Tax=Streptomyces harbinensis TaxID=1176198 RepID=UPI00158FCEF4|nr:ATP-binding cassette domain-containing protein [Streptomyces harbinensis]QKV71488.1 ABC transporter ATP-binding protein [Streptomyces harbinensis]
MREPPAPAAVAAIDRLVVGPAAGGPPVLDGAGLRLHTGETLALYGRSGSGKTTLALSLLGHLRPGLALRSGTVRVGGIDPFTTAGRSRVRTGVVSFLGQDPAAALNPGRRLGGLLREAARRSRPAAPGGPGTRERIERALAEVDLPTDRAFLRRYPHEISGGQAQRAALVIATLCDPVLLVLDEPTSGLDRRLADELCALLGARRRAGSGAMLLVSHDRELIGALADRTLRVADGRLLPPGEDTAAPRPAPRPPARPAALVLPSAPPGPSGSRPPAPPAPPGPSGSRPPVLELTGLRAGHGRRITVAGVSLTVAPGGCTALAGASGAGKSTVAHCLVGLHPALAGRLTLEGREVPLDLRRRSPRDRRALQLVAQDSVDALNPREPVRRTLLRPLTGLRGMAPEEAASRVHTLLEQVCLPARLLDRLPHQLSGGERQRVNLARALAAGPRVLVCDEVTSALDTATRDAILDLLAELRRTEGLSVVLISHDARVRAAADRVVVLDAGRPVPSGDAPAPGGGRV